MPDFELDGGAFAAAGVDTRTVDAALDFGDGQKVSAVPKVDADGVAERSDEFGADCVLEQGNERVLVFWRWPPVPSSRKRP